MRHLYIIEKNDVFELRGVADDAVIADERIAADESAGAHLGLMPDDARRAEIRGGIDLRVARDPNALLGMVVFVRAERRAERGDQ